MSRESEIRDRKLYELFSQAVGAALDFIRDAQEKNLYIGKYLEFPKLSWRENGLPNFEDSIFDEPLDYKTLFQGKIFGRVFGESEAHKEVEDGEAFSSLRTYIATHPRYSIFFGAHSDTFFATSVNLLVEYSADRYIHLNKSSAILETAFLEVYLPIEAFICSDHLSFDIVVPIVGMIFDAEGEIAPGYEIWKMDDCFQIARRPNSRYSFGHHPYVAEAATHALVLHNYQIENATIWEHWNLGNQEAYKADRIDFFFATLRIVLGVNMGYAQIIARPDGWAGSYTAWLPPILTAPTMQYPRQFERGVWNDKVPRVTQESFGTISDLWIAVLSLVDLHPKLAFSLQRLNSAFLRDTEDDSIVDSTVALEALLSDSHEEMTHKLALRVAALVSLAKIEATPEEVFREVKYIYGFRSAVVHGDVANINKRRTIQKEGKSVPTVQLALKHLRCTQEQLIRYPEYLIPATVDKELLLRSLLYSARPAKED